MSKKQPTKAEKLEEIQVKLAEVADLLDDLATELEDAWSNVEDTNLANTERNQRLSENAEAVRGIADEIGNQKDELDGVEL